MKNDSPSLGQSCVYLSVYVTLRPQLNVSPLDTQSPGADRGLPVPPDGTQTVWVPPAVWPPLLPLCPANVWEARAEGEIGGTVGEGGGGGGIGRRGRLGSAPSGPLGPEGAVD